MFFLQMVRLLIQETSYCQSTLTLPVKLYGLISLSDQSVLTGQTLQAALSVENKDRTATTMPQRIHLKSKSFSLWLFLELQLFALP